MFTRHRTTASVFASYSTAAIVTLILALPVTARAQAGGDSVTPQQFGAKADGHTDDTAAIQKAIDSGKKVFLPEGQYNVGGQVNPGPRGNYLENYLLKLRSNLEIKGAGKKTIIFLKDHLLDGTDDKTSNAHIFAGWDVENVSISGIQFYMNGAHNLTPQGKIRNAMAIYVSGGKDVDVEHNWFYNCAGRNVVTLRPATGSGAVISNNEFRNGGHYVGDPKVENTGNTDFSFIYTEWASSAVDNNWIEEDDLAMGLNTKGMGPGGIELHGSNSHANGNTIIGTMPAIYIDSAPVPVSNMVVRNNKIKNSIEGIHFVQPKGDIADAQIVENEISVTQTNAGDGGPCYAIFVSNAGGKIYDEKHDSAGVLKNLTIRQNVITNSFPMGKPWSCGGMILHSLHGADISGNTITGMTGTGIILMGSPWGSNDVKITGNKILDCGSMAPDAFKTGLFVTLSGSADVPPRKFHGENITITGNTLGNDKGQTAHSGITFGGLRDSDIRNLQVSNNTIQGVSAKLSDGHVEVRRLEELNPEAHAKQ